MTDKRPGLSGMPLLDYGFRPFFLAAGIYAVLAVLAWLAWLAIHAMDAIILNPTTDIPVLLWHGHEMVFGYAAAVIAGFLLTAIPNWAKGPPLSGMWLAALVLLWLLGRLAFWYAAYVPKTLAAVVDLAFLPVLIGYAGAVLWRSGARRNLALMPILILLWIGNLLVHLEIAGWGGGAALDGLRLAIDSIILLIAIIGGRVTPAFTRSGLEGVEVRSDGIVDRVAVLTVALIVPLDFFLPEGKLTASVFALAAIVNGARMIGWRGTHTGAKPILWVLHLGYGWLVLGLACRALAGFTDLLPPSAALHALTMGAIGTYTLGVMTRAALGHTGRPLAVHGSIALAYGLVSLAALTRVFGPSIAPAAYTEVTLVSGGLWIAAFVMFTVVYAPILMRERVSDGRD